MKNSIIILIFLSGMTNSLFTQNSVYADTLTHKYVQNTIYLKKGGFEKDGKTIRFGTFKKNLKKEMMASPMAFAEFKRSRTNAWVVVGCTVAPAILTVSGTQRVFVKKELNYSGFGLNLLSIPFKIKSLNHLNRAIWLYNRDAILRQ